MEEKTDLEWNILAKVGVVVLGDILAGTLVVGPQSLKVAEVVLGDTLVGTLVVVPPSLQVVAAIVVEPCRKTSAADVVLLVGRKGCLAPGVGSFPS